MITAGQRYIDFCTKILPQAGICYKTLYIVERLHARADGNIHATFVIVLLRKKDRPVEDRVRRLYGLLQKALLPDEHLDYCARAVSCIGKGYRFAFIVEAYNKRPSMTAFLDATGAFHHAPLYRMPTFESIRRAKALSGNYWDFHIEKSPFQNYLDEPDLVETFPNAADRLAFVVKREQAKSSKTYAELMESFKCY